MRAIEVGIGLCGVLVLFGDAADRRNLRFGRRPRHARHPVPRHHLRHLPAAAHILWARRCPPSRAGLRLRRAAFPGWACSMAATPRARCSDACWPASILLRVFDMATATFVAVAINMAVAAGQLRARQDAPRNTRLRSPASRTRAVGSGHWPVYPPSPFRAPRRWGPK